MSGDEWPILYSFRRCPYAMRARMAILVSGQRAELREVVLRNKPAEMLEASPKGTVPVLIDTDGTVIDESLDIMRWALGHNDPAHWLGQDARASADITALIDEIDGPFKVHLDRYKYATRYAHENDGAGVDPIQHRQAALEILAGLDERLQSHRFLICDAPSLADFATAPFVRQFANTDITWFSAQPYPNLQAWLETMLSSEIFAGVMKKYAPWQSGTAGVPFPD